MKKGHEPENPYRKKSRGLKIPNSRDLAKIHGIRILQFSEIPNPRVKNPQIKKKELSNSRTDRIKTKWLKMVKIWVWSHFSNNNFRVLFEKYRRKPSISTNDRQIENLKGLFYRKLSLDIELLTCKWVLSKKFRIRSILFFKGSHTSRSALLTLGGLNLLLFANRRVNRPWSKDLAEIFLLPRAPSSEKAPHNFSHPTRGKFIKDNFTQQWKSSSSSFCWLVMRDQRRKIKLILSEIKPLKFIYKVVNFWAENFNTT